MQHSTSPRGGAGRHDQTGEHAIRNRPKMAPTPPPPLTESPLSPASHSCCLWAASAIPEASIPIWGLTPQATVPDSVPNLSFPCPRLFHLDFGSHQSLHKRSLIPLDPGSVCVRGTGNPSCTSYILKLHRLKGKSYSITFEKDFRRFGEGKGILRSHGDVVFHSERGQRRKLKLPALKCSRKCDTPKSRCVGQERTPAASSSRLSFLPAFGKHNRVWSH